MKMNSRRYRRHRNPEKTDQKEGPFFSPTSNAIQTKEDAFFQPKLAVGEPGDQYEQEADSVADKVVNKQPARGTAVQRKEISAVQAMPEKKEEEKQVQKKGMNDKKEEEKPVQKKSAPDKKEEETPVQKKGDKGKEEELLQKKASPEKKEEEKIVQKKGDKAKEEEQLQKKAAPDKKEEEKLVQKKEEPEKKPAADEVLKEEKEEEKKGGTPSLMAKENNSSGAREGSDQLAQQLKDQRGDGALLPRDVRNEMSESIGADFSNVRIHTGEKAAALSDEIGAQAFTHGNDVYFNSGKYDTDSSAGKHLLAHELTHVVQQGAAPAIEGKASSVPAAHATPGVQREISTPLPEGVKPDEQSKIAYFPIGSFKVEIRPDRKAREDENIPADRAFTSGSIDAQISYELNRQNKVTRATISKTLIIETIYGANATSKGESGYGRGFIKSDKEKGNTSLGFHEGNHGIDFMDYIKTHPFPEIVIRTPITEAAFETLKAEWEIKRRAYVADMLATSETKTDKVTDPPAPAAP
ncbi:DUF4157 domain-containing protein [Chitinophaga filiformis]|uniref:eCIS core domain-containing protein n=1 Tax=Chitinophaga filiformis TaxID=104663 RepID=UPI001F189A07|nr:DUF4157 domain-containing protein [Chitinophaga filiformis]MCF6404963.1 DUF4157 domain-containing protein [Chitinophaga filiformis]